MRNRRWNTIGKTKPYGLLRGSACAAGTIFVLTWMTVSTVFGAGISEQLVNDLTGTVEAEMAAQQIPGAAIAWFDRDEILWAEEFGWTDRSRKTPIGPDTLFSAQSTSKLMTALALLHAQENGLVDLDAVLTEYLPELELQSVWQELPQKSITVRQLLNHTSGLPHEARVNNNFSLHSGTFDEHLASIGESWLKFPSSSRQAYSNLGYSLAGQILEEVSGVPYATYVERHVLKPAGVTRGTSRRETALADTNRALGHSAQFSQVPECPAVPAAGGFYGTAQDLARIIQLVMRDGKTPEGKRWLAPRSIADLFEMPFAADGQRSGHGLGLEKKVEGAVEYFLAPGRGFGFIGGAVWVPEADLGMAMLFNNQDATLPYQLLFEFMRAAAGRLPKDRLAAEEKAEPIGPGQPNAGLERIAGEYIGEEGRLTVVRGNGTLLIDAGDGAGPRPSTPISERVVMYDDPGRRVRLRFIPDLGTGLPALVDLEAGIAYLANFGPAPKSAAPSRWSQYVGTYHTRQWGRVVASHRFEVRNGIAYWDDLRLDERRKGLFFSPTGEALDLRGPTPFFSGIELERDAESKDAVAAIRTR